MNDIKIDERFQIRRFDHETIAGEIEAIKQEQQQHQQDSKDGVAEIIMMIIIYGILLLVFVAIIYGILYLLQLAFGDLPPIPWYISILFLLILFKR